MNPQVEEFIQKQKEKQKLEREKHLIELGLFTVEGEKKYSPWVDKDSVSMGYILKDEKGYYRIDGPKKALDVTDEEYEAICQFSPNPSSKERHIIDFCNNVVITLDTLRKMIKFFVVLTIIEIICGIIVVICVL